MGIFNEDQWALILGGSSGFGLATAKKLSAKGMSVFLVHRDRKGAMSRINEEFDCIRQNGHPFITMNQDALSLEGQQNIIENVIKSINNGHIRVLLHSIAFGNLKPVAPVLKSSMQGKIIDSLANELKIDVQELKTKIHSLFEQNNPELYSLNIPQYSESLLEDEDVAHTIYSMGTSMLTWTQKLFNERLFANDARVIGLTSEGNQIAWRGYAAVSAAKVALEAVSRSIAVEFAPYGIRSNIVQAGVTETPALAAIPGSDRMKAFARLRNPFKRLTTPEDVANVIMLLCMNESAWINGTIIHVDGGEHISSF